MRCSYLLELAKAKRLKQVGPILGILALLVLSSLACSWVEWGTPPKAKRVVIRNSLPTLTPTPRSHSTADLPTPVPTNFSPGAAPPPTVVLAPLPTATFTPAAVAVYSQEQTPPPETPLPSPTNLPPTSPPSTSTSTPIPTPTATYVPTPSANPTPTVTPIPETPGWSFAKVRTYDNQYEGGLILYGELVNDTGAPQEIAYITGTFYDNQGQLIADSDSTTEYWPIEIIPPGGRTPFELAVNGIQAAANFKLWANSTTAGQAPRQDFNFDGVEQWQADEDYCLTGQLQNPGGDLNDFLVITAVLYDSQGDVINFGETYESTVAGGETLDFQICITPPNQDVARYELHAWGL